MENAPTIILFWILIAAILILMVVSMIAAIMMQKKSKEQSVEKMHLIGKLCLTLSIICAIPVFLVVGYVLYLYIG